MTLRPMLFACALAVLAPPAAAAAYRSMQQVLDASPASDWREPAPENVLYMELDAGRVVIELAPGFAPQHVANIRTLARAGFWDGTSIYRVQDNFVAQFGDADGWAPQVGFSDGFAAGRDAAAGKAWMAHCYGVVGAGRNLDADSSIGAELYVVIGQSPRQLDRNITQVGRVIQGIELLSSLRRGPEPMGFYADPAQRTPIRAVRLASEVPPQERTRLQLLRTDTQTFRDMVEARRNRRDDFYKRPAGHIDLCNVPLPVRVAGS